MSNKPLNLRNYSTERRLVEKEVLTYDFTRNGQDQPLNRNNTTTMPKILSVKVDESKYNFEQASFENASKGLINTTIKNPGTQIVALSSSSPTMTTNTDDSNHSLRMNSDKKLKKKKNQLPKSASSRPKSSSPFTCCYIVQQYLIYTILFSIILSGSFGFYYLLITTNLKIDQLEQRLNDKISTRLAIQLLSRNEYSDKSSNSQKQQPPTTEFMDMNLMVDRAIHLRRKFGFAEEELANSTAQDRHRFFVMNNGDENNSLSESIFTEKYYVMKRMGNFNFVIYPAHTKNSNVALNNFCKVTTDQCVELVNKKNPNKKETSNPQTPSINEHSTRSTIFKPKTLMDADSHEKLDYDSAENMYYHKTTPVSYAQSSVSSSIQRHLTTVSFKSPSQDATRTPRNATEIVYATTTTAVSFLVFDIDQKTSSSASIISDFARNSTESYLADAKLGKSRHRKRIELVNTTKINSVTSTDETTSFISTASATSQLFNAKIGCNLKYISMKPTNVVFMGVFHCAWMTNIASTANSTNYYITKGYKGSSLTMCLDLDELKSYRCYRHMPLQYSYYGTGHALYKGLLFYNQDGTNNLIVHNVETEAVTKVTAPGDAACCHNTDDGLYNVKHSGFFDFETDENGLWLIYKQTKSVAAYESGDDDYPATEYSSGVVEGKSAYDSFDQEVYVVAKIDEARLAELKIERKWTVRASKENVANMFIICGQLYALKNTAINPAQMYKLCDLINDASCSANYDSENSDLFNLTISSRQITSLKYDPDKKLLYMVDGGSFVYYKTQI